jgi:RNA polymerase sigma factor (sigma-70 family)
MISLNDQVGPLIPAMRRYARALLHDVTAADDLVQDALEKAVSRWHQRRDDSGTRAWLFAIVHNLAVNRMRQAKRRGPHLEMDDAPTASLGHPAEQEDNLRHTDLMRCVDALAEDQRAVLLLIAVEGLSYAEAAKVLDIPAGTVMSRLSRAREKLMSIMDKPVIAPYLRRVK